jgi:hypothetical protein
LDRRKRDAARWYAHLLSGRTSWTIDFEARGEWGVGVYAHTDSIGFGGHLIEGKCRTRYVNVWLPLSCLRLQGLEDQDITVSLLSRSTVQEYRRPPDKQLVAPIQRTLLRGSVGYECAQVVSVPDGIEESS